MIDFIDVSKSFGAQEILERVNLRINPGERVGVVGPNGSGKSTLFSMICGEMSPDSGSILLPNRMRISHLRQQLPPGTEKRSLLDYVADAIPELKTGAARIAELDHLLAELPPDAPALPSLLREHGELESRYAALGGYHLRNDAKTALTGLGFRLELFDAPLTSFSGGWQMRAQLARVLIANPDILLLDEPSNYLDIPAVEWLCRFLKSFQGTLMLISHDRFLLKRLVSIIVEINQAALTRYPGDYDYYRRERENRRCASQAAKRNQDRKLEQMQQNIDRFRYKASKAAMAQSLIRKMDKIERVEEMDGLGFSGSILLPPPPPSGVETARFENLDFSYREAQPLLKNVDFEIKRNDKIAIVGYNGTGKTTLLKLLTGYLKPRSGKVVLGHNVIVGYQAQEFSDILPAESTVYDVIRAAAGENTPPNSLRSVLGAFGFSGTEADKPIKVLSGGEKIRLCFARIFVNPPNLLVLDEPTTHLDIAAREALQAALKQYQGTVCMVSHDIEFVESTAETIIAMEPSGVRKYAGTYQYYLEKSTQLSTAAAAASASSAGVESPDQRKERRRERARLRQELQVEKKRYEKEVARLENAIEQTDVESRMIMEQLAGGEALDFPTLNRRLHELQIDQERYTGEWEIAAGKLEDILKRNAEIHSD